jgi:hypothetical protein
VVAASHRLVARFAAGRPDVATETSATTRKAFYQSHPWLQALLEADEDPASYEPLFEETDVDGVSAHVVELTGSPGDIVICHPLLAHSISPNCATQPRFMRIIRPKLRTR